MDWLGCCVYNNLRQSGSGGPKTLRRIGCWEEKLNSEEKALARLSARFPNDRKCYEFLERLRWPRMVKSVRCANRYIYRSIRKFRGSRSGIAYKCISCGFQFSPTTGTIFHRAHVPLWVWFAILWKFFKSKEGLRASWIVEKYHVTPITARKIRRRLEPELFKDDFFRKLLVEIRRASRKRRNQTEEN